jgi:pimeloyl-ACP methyl ester carboxylesterase
VSGQGPAVVLLHEGIADSRMWDAQVEALAPRHRVVRLDFRGFGRSEPPPGAYSNGRDVVGLLDALRIDRAALVGASMGGNVAVQVAVAHPERVSALVLVASALADHDWSEEVRRAWSEEEEAFERGDLDAAVEVNLRTWVDGPGRSPEDVDPALRERVGEMQRRALELYREDVGPEEPLTPDAPGRLGEIRAPTLVVVGDADVADMLDIAERLATGIPGARKVVVPGAAHAVPMEKPDEVSRAILEFLA